MTLTNEITTDAYHIFNNNRDRLGDRFSIEPLEVEFPYFADKLTREFGARGLLLARADDNEAGTFKTRGAYVGAHYLKEQGADKMRLFSAGNFASGAAVAGRLLQMETNIGVPTTAPYEKREGLYRFWDSPLLRIYPVGDTLEATGAWIAEHPELGAPLHPFNHSTVIDGAGTIADDIVAAEPAVRHVVVPVGGAGLLSGLLRRFEALDRGDIIVHGIEAPGSNSLSQSLQAGLLIEAVAPNSRYGGSCVKRVGDLALSVCKNAGARLNLLAVTDDEVDELTGLYQQSRRDLWRDNLPAYEPTTLVAVAGLRHLAKMHPNDLSVVVGTGHNAPLPQYI